MQPSSPPSRCDSNQELDSKPGAIHSDGKSVARGKEYSRIVPMIDIPGGTPPIAPSAQGFRVILDSFDPSDIRYALAYYYQLHGWGWEPRLF